jgi:hypothetical protein
LNVAYVPSTFTDAEILADWDVKAAYWEQEAVLNPEVAAVCLDYAAHLRTLAECLRMDMLEPDLQLPGTS